MAVQGWSWRHAGGSDVSAHLPAGQDTGQWVVAPVPRKQLQWLLTLRSESKDSPKLVATVRRPSRPRPSLSTQLMAAAVGSLLLPPTPTAVSRDCSQTQRPETGSACRLGPWSGLLAGMLLEAEGAAQFGVGAFNPSRHVTSQAVPFSGWVSVDQGLTMEHTTAMPCPLHIPPMVPHVMAAASASGLHA